MDLDTPQITPLWMLAAMAFAVWASLAVWLTVVARLRAGLPVLPFQRRRRVPWRSTDVFCVLAVYMTVGALTISSGKALLNPAVFEPLPSQLPSSQSPPSQSDTDKPNAVEADREKPSSEHIIGQLLREGSPGLLLLAALSAVVVAPISEELFFRLLLQGYLESASHRLRNMMGVAGRVAIRVSGPILITSLLFAAMHFRTAGPTRHVRYIAWMIAADMVAKLVAVAFMFFLLRRGRGATAADLGWDRRKLLTDIRLGLLTFVGIAAPLYAVQFSLFYLLPRSIAPDPIALFPFAVALGVVYWRTHRIVPVIVIHASLNATSLVLALLLLSMQA